MNEFCSVNRIKSEVGNGYQMEWRNIMKKSILGVLGMVVAFSMCTTTAFAAGHGCGRNFVDADGDGVCDNINSTCIYTDADGDGICDNYATGQVVSGRHGRGSHGGCGNGFRGGHCR